MKKIQIGLVALAISALMATGVANAADSNVEVKSSKDSVVVKGDEGKDKKASDIKPVKKEEPKFVMTKGSVYQQLSYDLRKEGYRLSWNLSQDFPVPVTNKTYKTWQESLLAMLDSVNKQGLFSDDNGNTVKALVCPQSHYVVVTTLQNTSGVVDSDKKGCNLISKAPEKEDESASLSAYDQSYAAGQPSAYDANVMPQDNNVDSGSLNQPALGSNKQPLQAFPPIQQQPSALYQAPAQQQEQSGIQPANLSALDGQ